MSGSIRNGCPGARADAFKPHVGSLIRSTSCAAGANTAASFTASFLAIKVEEITTQPPSGNVIPLPAVAWLLLGGLGGLAAMTRRKKA